MSEIDKRIIDTFAKTLPKMADVEKERLLAFGEGMAFHAQMQKEKEAERNDA